MDDNVLDNSNNQLIDNQDNLIMIAEQEETPLIIEVNVLKGYF